VDKVEPVKRMNFILNPAVHVNAALFASMSLNDCFGIYDRKFSPIFCYGEVVSRHNGNL